MNGFTTFDPAFCYLDQYSNSPLNIENHPAVQLNSFGNTPSPNINGHAGCNMSYSLQKKQKKQEGIMEFFGEEFAGMEETLRSALLQYFSQVNNIDPFCLFLYK